jgi:hydroxymethylglutaryl-CoA synthase
VSAELGIRAVGGYVPRLRVDREEIASTHGWFNPDLRGRADGARSVCGWDEDAITMAVAASRRCLRGADRGELGGIYLASTTAPYADRLNAGVVAGALGLDERTPAFDLGGSLRAGTSALIAGLDASAAHDQDVLCVASDRRNAPPASVQELMIGHAAAAIVVGPGPGIARLVGRSSLTVDFVGHFREAGRPFDYQWEERWVREEGYGKLVPRLVGQLLENTGVAPSDVAQFCLPASLRRVDHAAARAIGLRPESIADQLAAGCGDSGAAHPLLMLADALHSAKPGDLIMVVAFAQGGDALLFEATDAVTALAERDWLAPGEPCTYPRYLALTNQLEIDRGMRAELDKGSALTASYRHRDLVLGLTGGRCSACGTYQIPRGDICVQCKMVGQLVPHSFAESTARVATWSADRLTYTPDPPAYYGLVDFAEGGRLLMDFTDIGPDGVRVGTQMSMVFRVKDHDRMRGYARYFWKAAPHNREEA